MTISDTATTDSATTGRRTVVGVFQDPAQAERALNDLRDAGFSPDQVSVVARDTRESRALAETTSMGAETAGASTGAFLGGVTGGILGWLVGIGALALPGIGPIVAAGALATTLGGAAVGALAGGLIGGLVGMGIPEEEARGYEESVRAGRILLTVSTDSQVQSENARAIFDRHSGADVRDYGGTTAPAAPTTRTPEMGSTLSHTEPREAGALAGGTAGAATGAAVGETPGAATGSASGATAGAAAGASVPHETPRPGDMADGSEGSATGSRTARP